MKHPPRSAFGASPQGAPSADRQSRIRGGRLMNRFDASRIRRCAVEQLT
jgi:hypothetical protein